MVLAAADAPFPSFTAKWHTTSYPSISPTRKELTASHKSVFITGGGSGIGARTALSFAEAGARHIAILGRRQERLLETQEICKTRYPDVPVSVYVADVTKKEEVDKAFSDFAGSVGKVDVLVNNAGLGDIGPFIKDHDIGAWMCSIEVNLKGSLLVTQTFLHHAASDAIIVNVASLASFMPLMGGISAYSVSKAASVTFFGCVQVENPNIRVVSIQPGVIDTEMNRKSGLPGMDDASLPADFTVWLASPEASFLGGKYVFVNWDVGELESKAEDISGTGLLEMWIDGLLHKRGQ